MTIGKIYCAKLIYENYKHMKKKRLEKKKKVSEVCQYWSTNLNAEHFYPSITFTLVVYIVSTIGSYVKKKGQTTCLDGTFQLKARCSLQHIFTIG